MLRTSLVPASVLRHIVAGATRAPSVHNSQPWRWRATADSLELRVDPGRRPPGTDPTGRNATISCGAALHHAQVVAAALGWSSTVDRHPEGSAAELLARVHHAPTAPPDDAAALLEAVELRATDRRRFTSWPVPEDHLANLAAVADAWGTAATAVADPLDRLRAERLLLQADARHAATTVGEQHPATARPVLDTDLDGQDLRVADALMVLHAGTDDATSWLRAGEGLSALWLAATTLGLSVVPLSRLTEVDETREAFGHQVLGGASRPLLLARVGWQGIGRSDLPRTPRRPVEDVLELT